MAEFQRAIERLFTELQAPPVLATVKAVDTTACTCECEPVAGGAPFANCRLRSVADGQRLGFLAFPKVGSLAILLRTSQSESVVLMASELDQVRVELDQVVVQVDAGGKVLVQASDIVVGNPQAADSAIVGTKAAARLDEIHGHLSSLHTALLAFAAAGAGASVGPLAPFLPAYTALTSAISPEVGIAATNRGKIQPSLSQHLKHS